MYSIKIPPKQLTALWSLREHAGCGPIAAQIRRAIEDYIATQQDEISQIETLMEQDGRSEEDQ